MFNLLTVEGWRKALTALGRVHTRTIRMKRKPTYAKERARNIRYGRHLDPTMSVASVEKTSADDLALIYSDAFLFRRAPKRAAVRFERKKAKKFSMPFVQSRLHKKAVDERRRAARAAKVEAELASKVSK